MKGKIFGLGVFILVVAFALFYYGYSAMQQYKSYKLLFDLAMLFGSESVLEQVRIAYFTQLIGGMLGIIGFCTIVYGALATEPEERKIKDEI